MHCCIGCGLFFFVFFIMPIVIIDVVIILGNTLQFVTIMSYFFNFHLVFQPSFFLWLGFVGIDLFRSHSICVHSCWTLDVRRTASYEIFSSVCLSVCPSIYFLKSGSLVFSDIVHDDSLP